MGAFGGLPGFERHGLSGHGLGRQFHGGAAIGSWNDGPHIAPATADVVSLGGRALHTRTGRPISASQIAVVNPPPPAPTTTTPAA